jgi:hypothetical protein
MEEILGRLPFSLREGAPFGDLTTLNAVLLKPRLHDVDGFLERLLLGDVGRLR